MPPFFEMHSAVLTLLFKLRPIFISTPRRTREGKAFISKYGSLRGSLILYIMVSTEYHAQCLFSRRIKSIEDTNSILDYVTCIICDAMVYDCNGNMGYASESLRRANVPFASCILIRQIPLVGELGKQLSHLYTRRYRR